MPQTMNEMDYLMGGLSHLNCIRGYWLTLSVQFRLRCISMKSLKQKSFIFTEIFVICDPIRRNLTTALSLPLLGVVDAVQYSGLNLG